MQPVKPAFCKSFEIFAPGSRSISENFWAAFDLWPVAARTSPAPIPLKETRALFKSTFFECVSTRFCCSRFSVLFLFALADADIYRILGGEVTEKLSI